MIEEIEEPIEVLARFDRGKLYPFRFRWNQSVFQIEKVTSCWEDRQGQHRRCHFSVLTTQDDYYEIRFQTADFSWILSKASIDP